MPRERKGERERPGLIIILKEEDRGEGGNYAGGTRRTIGENREGTAGEDETQGESLYTEQKQEKRW